MQPEGRATGRFRLRGWDVLRLALGVLLLTAAVLKLMGRNLSAMPSVGWFGQPWVQLAVAEWEIVLGLWLLIGWYPVGSWLAAIITLLTFTGISGYFGATGIATCGCFGQIAASPWHAFAVDIVGLVVLTFVRPSLAQTPKLISSQLHRGALVAAVYLAGIGFLLAGVMGTATLVYGSPAVAVARLRNEALTVSPSHLDFGNGGPAEVLESTLKVSNWSDREVRLIGGTSDCSCVATQDLPRNVGPGETVILHVRLTMPAGRKGLFVRKAVILTDLDKQRIIRLSLGGRVQ